MLLCLGDIYSQNFDSYRMIFYHVISCSLSRVCIHLSRRLLRILTFLLTL